MKNILILMALLFSTAGFAESYDCEFESDGFICVKTVTPDPIPDPSPPPSISGLLYTDLVRAPTGTPITGFCSDGSTDTRPAIANMSLCGDPFSPEITVGQVIYASPPSIPQANSGDVIVLSAGIYTGVVDCGGGDVLWCGNGNSGVQIIGDTTGPKPVFQDRFHCGGGTAPISDITLANVELVGADIRCDQRGSKVNFRFANIYCHDAASRNSGACGNWSNSAKLRVLGFKTRNTGVPGENNAHSLYHGGRGENFDVEFGWLDLADHVGGRCFQVYGHLADEVMRDIYVHDSVASSCQGNASFLISGSDAREPDGTRAGTWIDRVRFERNTFEKQARFSGTNLNGGQDWTADGNTGPIHSSMGGDPSTWVEVTNNDGEVTGNVR